MDLNAEILPPAFAWSANGLAGLFLAVVARATDWRRLKDFERANAWLLTAAFIAALWAMRAEVASGLNLHLSGATFFALVFGWRLATIGMSLVCAVMTIAGNVLPLNLGAQIFLDAVLPVSVAYGLFLLSEARLPRHFFVYVFGPAFFGPWITTAVLAFATSLLLTIFGSYGWAELEDAFLPFFLILGFSEAFTTGFVITLFVVYKPHWVYTFRDDRYLTGK
ncbi:MAG: hypothetical protein DWQ08_00905 [Proteobacteria bacterium]|nr:MAG: hypothetical protein DWQ08_00905 [Pseudomonadota bacterium]